MPQASYIYANARVGVAQTRLLTPERVERMTEAKDASEALKVLQEAGYGGNREVKSAFDFQQLIDDELKKAYDFIYEITPDKDLTDLFLVPFDFHNVKALVKGRLLSEEDDDTLLYPVGTVPYDRLKAGVRDRDYRSLPGHLAELLEALDQMLAGRSGSAGPGHFRGPGHVPLYHRRARFPGLREAPEKRAVRIRILPRAVRPDQRDNVPQGKKSRFVREEFAALMRSRTSAKRGSSKRSNSP